MASVTGRKIIVANSNLCPDVRSGSDLNRTKNPDENCGGAFGAFGRVFAKNPRNTPLSAALLYRTKNQKHFSSGRRFNVRTAFRTTGRLFPPSREGGICVRRPVSGFGVSNHGAP